MIFDQNQFVAEAHFQFEGRNEIKTNSTHSN